jgi:hypothetical protein
MKVGEMRKQTDRFDLITHFGHVRPIAISEKVFIVSVEALFLVGEFVSKQAAARKGVSRLTKDSQF